MNFNDLALTVLVCVFVLSRVLKLFRGIKAVNYLPGERVPFQGLAFPGALFPTSWWNPGLDFTWERRTELYETYQNENVSVVPFLSGVPVTYTSNLDVVRQIVAGGHKCSFVKPESATRALWRWGMNVIASEGDTWRRHRRVMGPAFNPTTYQLVWETTMKTFHEMADNEGWASKDVVVVPAVQSLMYKLALIVIATCGFGFHTKWTAPPVGDNGEMSVQESLRIVADESTLMITVPKWLWRIPTKRFRDMRTAYVTLDNFMRKKVVERKAEIHELIANGEIDNGEFGRDMFSMLVRANETEGKLKLDDQELVGNMFGLLVAGHETTASALTAAFGLLSVHPEIQSEVRAQILEVVGHDRVPEFEDLPKLDKVQAVLYETIRMFPAASVLVREATEDTVLTIPKPPGEEGSDTFPVPKGVQVVADMIGVGYNPRYFSEPRKFRPSRWYGLANEETFTGFSMGARACIGRKFAAAEGVCVLTLMLRDWDVEPLLNPGETHEEWAERVLQARLLLTLGVTTVPVRFVKRK